MKWYNPTDRMAGRAAGSNCPACAGRRYLIAESDIIFLGMKPQVAAMSLLLSRGVRRTGGHLDAGGAIEELAALIEAPVELVRVMPNTPVALGRGVVGAAPDAEPGVSRRCGRAARPPGECSGWTRNGWTR